jgi:hypothetical protein
MSTRLNQEARDTLRVGRGHPHLALHLAGQCGPPGGELVGHHVRALHAVDAEDTGAHVAPFDTGPVR